MSRTAEKLNSNWLALQQRAVEAAKVAGREATDVRIVGVTKYVSPEIAEHLFLAGCHLLGESRPQALLEKVEQLAKHSVQWHMIGHLQRNKVTKILPHVSLIHSVDSVRLANTIDRLAGEQRKTQDVLLEVNVSGEEAKHGFSESSLQEQLAELLSLKHIRLCGLMCMAGLRSDETQTRRQFATLRELLDSLQRQVDEHPMNELSMGMSGDFELAIEEGATIVRVGSVLFEGMA